MHNLETIHFKTADVSKPWMVSLQYDEIYIYIYFIDRVNYNDGGELPSTKAYI